MKLPDIMIKVSIYIVNHNYGDFLQQCIESVLSQTFKDYEVIILDCGSEDNSSKILNRYKKLKNFKIIFLQNQPLAMTNNIAIALAKGDYIMRLDADDYLHENAVGILSGILDRNKSLGLVFPDYFEVDKLGNIISLVRRHNFKNVTLKDQPAHGACTLIRKNIIEKAGFYDEEFTCQDGWDLWLKVTKISEVFNTNLPLFFYRKHDYNLTRNEDRLLTTRSKILMKNNKKGNIKKNKAIAIILVRGKGYFETEQLLKPFQGQSILERTINTSLKANLVDKVVFSSTSKVLIKNVEEKFGKKVLTLLRREMLPLTHQYFDETIFNIMGNYREECERNFAGILVNVEYPFIKENDIDAAISSLQAFKTDLVLGVRKEERGIYKHDGHKLNLLNNNNIIVEEKNEVYVEGALRAFRFDELKFQGSLTKIKKIGHVALSEKSFYHAKSSFLLNSILDKT